MHLCRNPDCTSEKAIYSCICKQAFYCSQTCQAKDLSVHKFLCFNPKLIDEKIWKQCLVYINTHQAFEIFFKDRSTTKEPCFFYIDLATRAILEFNFVTKILRPPFLENVLTRSKNIVNVQKNKGMVSTGEFLQKMELVYEEIVRQKARVVVACDSGDPGFTHIFVMGYPSSKTIPTDSKHSATAKK